MGVVSFSRENIEFAKAFRIVPDSQDEIEKWMLSLDRRADLLHEDVMMDDWIVWILPEQRFAHLTPIEMAKFMNEYEPPKLYTFLRKRKSVNNLLYWAMWSAIMLHAIRIVLGWLS